MGKILIWVEKDYNIVFYFYVIIEFFCIVFFDVNWFFVDFNVSDVFIVGLLFLEYFFERVKLFLFIKFIFEFIFYGFFVF